MREKLTYGLLLITVFVVLTGCNSWKKEEDRMMIFSASFSAYSSHLRWGHFYEVSAFMTADYIPSVTASIPSLKNVRITAVEPLKWVVDEAQESLSGSVQISYYLTDRGVVKQINQQQTWLWFEESRTWRLDTGLPELN